MRGATASRAPARSRGRQRQARGSRAGGRRRGGQVGRVGSRAESSYIFWSAPWRRGPPPRGFLGAALLGGRGGRSLRLRDGGMTLVPTTVGRGLLRHGQVLRLRLGGRDRGAVRRLGGIRRLGRGGSGGRRRGRRLGGEHRGGEQADSQQGRSNSLHRQGTSWAASTRHRTGGLRRRLAAGPSLDAAAALREECARPGERLDADAVQLSDAPGSRMSARPPRFDAPSPFDRVFNRLFGILVGLGLALPHNYLLQVRGRKSGRLYSTPIDVLEHGGRRFLVAGRGETQWVRNARASGQVTLRKGMRGERCRLRALSDAEKPEVLKAYLDRFKMTVQRYFPIPAGSPVERFAPVAAGYPVFELKAAREGDLTSGE